MDQNTLLESINNIARLALAGETRQIEFETGKIKNGLDTYSQTVKETVNRFLESLKKDRVSLDAEQLGCRVSDITKLIQSNNYLTETRPKNSVGDEIGRPNTLKVKSDSTINK